MSELLIAREFERAYPDCAMSMSAGIGYAFAVHRYGHTDWITAAVQGLGWAIGLWIVRKCLNWLFAGRAA